MPITPANLNLRIVTGIIFGPVILRAKDADGNPIDLTGWKPFAEVRKKPGSSLILDLQPYFSDFLTGEITIPKMTDEQTYNLNFGDFQWSLILEDPSGDRYGPYIQGSFIIAGTPTKPPEGAVPPGAQPVQPGVPQRIYGYQIVSLTGPDQPALNTVSTNMLVIDTLIEIVIAEQAQLYQLRAGPADPLDPGEIAPLDYDATSNDKNWCRVK